MTKKWICFFTETDEKVSYRIGHIVKAGSDTLCVIAYKGSESPWTSETSFTKTGEITISPTQVLQRASTQKEIVTSHSHAWAALAAIEQIDYLDFRRGFFEAIVTNRIRVELVDPLPLKL